MSIHASASPNAFVPDESNTRLLRDAFGRFATGVTIVTAATEDGVAAITANSFSSVSLSPPLVLWSPDKASRRFSYFEQATSYAVHVLSAEQDDLCWAVARDAFALNDHNLSLNAEGVPVLENCLARFECTKTAVYEGGDHVIMLGQVNRAQMREEGDPLAFYKGQVGRFTAD
ncbi:flavin reductase family protein [Litoreibacter albidus]|uniref:NADH-FMN oxidoreductase RutF, flavin reductase (DIM6/NTAB) family n=1 Tax=Litoreibacter albidus TaxID=670155 RepID=A0A1H3A460_9RHOB|nr:flavin reductase family protein [Litoreibacter albidus]SDX24201.1 NADH-FMN oxidoreductase RutF, flavin reductase (DIM6/NTAB) family [Litoreibacter albidus]